MIAIQVVAKEFRIVQGLVTAIKIVHPILGMKTDRVAMDHVKSVGPRQNIFFLNFNFYL